MCWVAVDKSGMEAMCRIKPFRHQNGDFWFDEKWTRFSIPSGSIEKLIGRQLVWDDDPVEI